MKIILQRDYYTTLLHKTHNKIEEIIFDSFFFVACYQLTTTHHFEPFRSVAPQAYFGAPYGAPCTPVEERCSNGQV